MSIKVEEDYRFSRKVATGVIVFVLLVAMLMFFAGSTVVGRTETIALSTVIRVHNSTVLETQVQTSVQYVTVTRTNFTTVYYIGPDTVQVSGKASTTGIGTTPTYVVFQDEKNQTILATVTNGAYSIALNNHHWWTVFIRYTSNAGLTSGQCSSGGLVLFYTGTAISANWRC